MRLKYEPSSEPLHSFVTPLMVEDCVEERVIPQSIPKVCLYSRYLYLGVPILVSLVWEASSR